MNAYGLRKAAVALAYLHPDDQTWLLEKLQPGWRHDLRQLIRQVESMKIPDPGIAHEAVRALEDEQPVQPPTPDRLLAGMHGLSPSWCARVLVACAPDHVDVFAANSTPAEAKAVRAELLTLPSRLPPKLSETLTRLVHERGERGLSLSKGAH